MTTQADVNLVRIFLSCSVREGDFSAELLNMFEREADAWEQRKDQPNPTHRPAGEPE